MEFRVFLPWSSSFSSLVTSSVSDIEQRVDSYVVTPEKIGIKVRNLKKLEMKVRTNIDESSGIETYVKVKFGKKGVGRYIADILQTLANMGISDHEEYKKCLDNVKYIEVDKKREIITVGECTIEVCVVRVGDVDWLSIAVEGYDRNAIQNVLKESTHHRAIQIKQLLKESLQHISSAFDESTLFIPFIGGYPRFIRHISSLSTYEEKSRLLASYCSFVGSL